MVNCSLSSFKETKAQVSYAKSTIEKTGHEILPKPNASSRCGIGPPRLVIYFEYKIKLTLALAFKITHEVTHLVLESMEVPTSSQFRFSPCLLNG